MDLSAFANPWEHARLLSDPARNEAMITLLQRRAPGARVVEVGCGSGLLSCIAARLGASHVIAVEPTAVIEVAREIVKANKLEDRVEVVEGLIADIEPRQVDLAFSELLNADPFSEGVLEAMEAVSPWLSAGGFSSPTRLRVYAALARASGSPSEMRGALRQIGDLAERYSLNLSLLSKSLVDAEAYTYLTTTEFPISDPILLFDLPIGTPERPPEVSFVEITPREPGPIGGVIVWFEADLDEGLMLANTPGESAHWGQLVSAFPSEIGGRPGHPIRLRIEIDSCQLTVLPAC